MSTIDNTLFPLTIEFTCYDDTDLGDDAGDGAGDDTGSDAGSDSDTDSNADSDDKSKGKTFDQEAVNKFLAAEKRKFQAKLEELEKQNTEALKNAKLTQQERESLENNLSDLRKQFRTKEQEAAEQAKTLEEKYQTEVATLKAERDSWQKQYTESTIRRSLMDAAVDGKAYNPAQVVTMLWGNTKLVDKTDEEGNKTGEQIAMVDLQDVDEKGNPVITQRTPMDAITRMAEMNAHANLFSSNVTSGLSATSNTGGLKPGSNGKVDVSKLSHDQYMRLRKESPELLGL